MAFTRPRSHDDNVAKNVYPTLNADFTSLSIAAIAITDPPPSSASPKFRSISDTYQSQRPQVFGRNMISPNYIDVDDGDFRNDTPISNHLSLQIQKSNVKRPRAAFSEATSLVKITEQDCTDSEDIQNVSHKRRSYDCTQLTLVRPRLAMRIQHKKWAEERDCLLQYFAQSLSESAIVTAQRALPSNESTHAAAFASMMTCSDFWNEFVSMDEEVGHKKITRLSYICFGLSF